MRSVKLSRRASRSHCSTSALVGATSRSRCHASGAAAVLPNAAATSVKSMIFTTPSPLTSAVFCPVFPKLEATNVRSMILTTLSLLTSSGSCGGSVISAFSICGTELLPELSVNSTSVNRTVDALTATTSKVMVASVPFPSLSPAREGCCKCDGVALGNRWNKERAGRQVIRIGTLNIAERAHIK